MTTSIATEELLEKYSECSTLKRLGPIMTILVCLTLSTFILVYKMNFLESVGSYVILSIVMGLVSVIIGTACIYWPEWSGIIGLVLLSTWTCYIAKIWQQS